ncbi:tRNA pseudouridine(55) synthase TruB [Legionella hackeliae]|uniref:tRNA pseudouridine synthase B n=1 Tax=Legionella hackeliae TaxID=449 RepID=A0A0A8UWP1_LEGHA|nr:tRNA pseudouridine(55) synthase TruB [Legionella hackeliae]KTD12551.1 tRNA pseudouridine synthase B [Legionella hackeliae]CEK11966.1 tRNA pseudouridine synthase B [Legionella hackeliae]STX48745.1 tRNA pseudouridine synthase B [Legionella hackeliae]
MSKISCDQSINGILLVNKPQGLSSNAVLQRVKRLYRAKKAGHTGSLDPLATGMLPICLGEATKFCQYLLDADKVYEATALLGIKTDTGDALGQIIQERKDFSVSEHELHRAMCQFTGHIKQVPSMFSALKHKGVPLYKYAREGVNIEREARNIIIHQLELTAFHDKSFDIKVSCSKGTYIRNLVEDIGDYLGPGAHITRLHRVCTAGFSNERMYGLDDLQEKSMPELLGCLLPMERAVNHFPAIVLNHDEILALRQGKVLKHDNDEGMDGYLRLQNNERQFIGLGVLSSGELTVKRLLTEEASNAIF